MDIDSDGIDDIVSGSYGGDLYWFKGTGNGFLPVQELPQATDTGNLKLFNEFMFAGCTFSDFNSDGKYDAFMVGKLGPRVSINEGTEEKPYFGKRIPLMCEDGTQVSTVYPEDFEKKPYQGFVVCVDWDSDGVKDLITTQDYVKSTYPALLFHKGVMKDGNLVFRKPVDMIKSENGGKALPGNYLVPFVCDFNNDGVKDMILGTTVKYDKKNGLYNDFLNYSFKDNTQHLLDKSKEINYVYDNYVGNPEKIKEELSRIEMDYHVGKPVEYSPEYVNRGILLLFEGR